MSKHPENWREEAAKKFGKLLGRTRPQGKKIDTKKEPIKPDRGREIQ